MVSCWEWANTRTQTRTQSELINEFSTNRGPAVEKGLPDADADAVRKPNKNV